MKFRFALILVIFICVIDFGKQTNNKLKGGYNNEVSYFYLYCLFD